MISLSISNVSKSYGVTPIIEQVSFSLQAGEKASLIGLNGAGKTTLFRLIHGDIAPDQGQISYPKQTKIGYLDQQADLESDQTIYTYVLSVFSDIMEMEQTIRSLEQEIAYYSDDPVILSQKMEAYTKLTETFTQKNGFSYLSEVRGVLFGLGFTEESFEKSITLLSGGEKTRLKLASLLLRKPDILMLDEPTNHLDVSSVEWLELFLRQYDKTVLIISHDRFFLDQITSKTLLLENRKLHIYNGNYSFYYKQSQINRNIQQKAYQHHQDEIKRQETIIRQLKSYGSEKKIKRAKSREKALEKMEEIEKPTTLQAKAKLSFPIHKSSGRDVLHIENLSKKFDNRWLFRHFDFDVYRGDKIGLLGANGSGKSTLFNILFDRAIPDSGNFSFGVNVQASYFDQKRMDLDPNISILDTIWNEYPTMKETDIRNHLGAFLFHGDDVFKLVSSLSGGEKARLSLLKQMLTGANFLFLDEPTNHLDIASKEVLEEALQDYQGTLFMISHDRYFLNQVPNRILVLEDQTFTSYLGNYDNYIEKKQMLIASQEQSNENIVTKTQKKIDQKKEKEKQKQIRKQKKQLANLEEEIANLEEKLEEADKQLCQEDIYSDPEASVRWIKKKENLKIIIAEKMKVWEDLQIVIENNE